MTIPNQPAPSDEEICRVCGRKALKGYYVRMRADECICAGTINTKLRPFKLEPSDEEVAADVPIFSRRKLREKVQVRFFTNKQIYRDFVQSVKSQDMFMQDVFSDFMVWFISASKNGGVSCQNEREEKEGK